MIATKRLLLRPIQASDNHQLFAYRRDAQTNKFQGFIPKTIEEVDDFIAKNPSGFNEADSWFQLAIVEKLSKTVIGDIGIHFIGTDDKQCEIGVTLSRHYHGQGLAKESINGVLAYLFNKMNKHRITASIDPDNTASLRLFESLGFRKEAHFKESLWIGGQWVDDIIYGMLNKEWNS